MGKNRQSGSIARKKNRVFLIRAVISGDSIEIMENSNNNQARTISTVMLITLLGKVLGLVRDRLLAVHYGTGMEANAFLTASRIPRVFFDMLFASAIAASFIPIFSESLQKKGREHSLRFAGNFITVIAALTLFLTVVGILFSDPLVDLFAKGYDEETAMLSVKLTRIMFPTIFFTGIAYSFVGILQSFDEFNIPAFISVLSNAVIILYYPTLNRYFGIGGLAVAFLIGWSVQAFVQIPSLRKKGFRYYPSMSVRNEEMRKVFALMLPVMVSTWVQPVMLTINSRFASYLYNGSGVSAIEYSTNLYLMIIGVFILSVTNVIFPKLSRLEVADKKEEFIETIRSTMHVSLFFVIPLMAGVMSLSREIIGLIYGGGQFHSGDTEITSRALMFTSLGMVGYAVQNIIGRAYFAKQDGRTPLIAGIISIAADVVLCFVLVGRFSVSGLAIASAAAGTVNAIVLMVPLERRGEGFLSVAFLADMLKVTLSSLIMGIVVRWTASSLSELVDGTVGKFLVILVPTFLGMVVFFALTYLCKVEESRIIGEKALGVIRRKENDRDN